MKIGRIYKKNKCKMKRGRKEREERREEGERRIRRWGEGVMDSGKVITTMSSGMASKLLTPNIFERSCGGASLLTHMHILYKRSREEDR